MKKGIFSRFREFVDGGASKSIKSKLLMVALVAIAITAVEPRDASAHESFDSGTETQEVMPDAEDDASKSHQEIIDNQDDFFANVAEEVGLSMEDLNESYENKRYEQSTDDLALSDSNQEGSLAESGESLCFASIHSVYSGYENDEEWSTISFVEKVYSIDSNAEISPLGGPEESDGMGQTLEAAISSAIRSSASFVTPVEVKSNFFRLSNFGSGGTSSVEIRSAGEVSVTALIMNYEVLESQEVEKHGEKYFEVKVRTQFGQIEK